MLRENTLFGIVDKEELAIKRLKHFVPPEGFYVSFSGGKDSIVLHKLCEMSGVKFDAHYNLTTVDPPEIVRFININYPKVEVHLPKMSMWQLIVHKKFLPTRLIRYCCDYLKEGGGVGRYVVTGIRWQESSRRSKRSMVELSKRGGKRNLIHPIIDFTEDDVWEFIRKHKLPYPSLYDNGWKRVGCIGCPMSSNQVSELEKYPKYKESYIRAIERMIKARTASGMETSWKTAEECFEWWVRNIPKEDGDCMLFE